ncbi:MAG: hypothetical protein VKN13_04485 [Cyanobacteriota bacterium]|nr:hypothetical protein [Cyanobacteriota bacterium]
MPTDPGRAPACSTSTGTARIRRWALPLAVGMGFALGLVAAPVGAAAETVQTPSLDGLVEACAAAINAGRRTELQALQRRLEARHPAPAPPPELEADARALLACAAPAAARRVLQRHGPAPGPDRDRWWLLEWQAAAQALQHEAAASALLAYAGGDPGRLARLRLSPALAPIITPVTGRAALDLLADHLEALGRNRQAAEVLLAGAGNGGDGVLLAERLQRVARLRTDWSVSERQLLLERALELAGAAGAWGLASELLTDQLALPVPGARERLLRLSGRLDDAYGEWRLRRQDGTDAPRTRQLERQLRSPLDATGHDPLPGPAPMPDR